MELKQLQNPDLTINELRDMAENASSEEVLWAILRHPHCAPDLKEYLFARVLPANISLDLTADNKLTNPKDSLSGKSHEDLDYETVDGLWEEIKALRELGVESFSLVGTRILGNLFSISLGEEPMEAFDFTIKRVSAWAMKPAMVATIISSITLSVEAKELSRMEKMAQELNQAGFETKVVNSEKKESDQTQKTRMEQQAEELRRAGFDVKVKK